MLKILLKDPRKAKTLLKENTALLQEDEGHLFGKKFRLHIIEIKRSKKKSLEVLWVIMIKILPCQKAIYLTKIDHKVERDTITRQNQVIETKSKIFDFKTTWVQVPESSTMQVQHQMVNTSFIIQKEVPLTSNSELVPLIKIATLEHVHPIIRKLFTKTIPNVPLAGGLAYFIAAWEKITRVQEILSIVKGYEIPFVSLLFQEKIPNLAKMSKKQFSLVEQEVLEILEKGAIQKVTRAIFEPPKQGQFLSHLILVEEKDGGNRPVINLKNLSKFIPYEHFEMEGVHCLKFILEQDDFLWKIDLKEAYFSVPLNKNSQKFVRFQKSGNIYEFLCFSFGLGPAPRIFTKLLKVPIAFLRRVNIRIIIYLDDMLLMGRTLPEILMARDTLIFLLQYLGFVINLKKSVLHIVKQIEFLGLVIDTEKMTFTLSEEKLKHVSQQCQEIFKQPKTSVLNLTKLIDLLSSTVQAILPA